MLATHDDHLPIGELAKLEVLLALDRLSTQQVFYLLVVDLKILNTELYLRTFCLDQPIDSLEDVTNCSWNDTEHLLNLQVDTVSTILNGINDRVWTKHRKSLARTALTVCKNCRVVAL